MIKLGLPSVPDSYLYVRPYVKGKDNSRKIVTKVLHFNMIAVSVF